MSLTRLTAIVIVAVLLICGCAFAQEEWQSRFERPLVFSPSQLKYNLYQNYLHRYMDRPLFMDTSMREPMAVLNCPSFQAEVDHAVMYELDGLGAIIGTPGMIRRYEIAMECAQQRYPENFLFFPLFGGDTATDYKLTTLQIAEASSATARFNHRGQELMRFGTYVGDRRPAEEVAEMLATLRAEHGDFIHMIQIHQWRNAHEEFRAGGVTPETDEAMKTHIRSYLDVADGIDMTYGGAWRRPDRTFDVEFDREYVIPTIKAVLSEPQYHDRFLALGGKIGYFQFMSGSTLDEDGTRTLRNSTEAAIEGRPDFIGLAEWDELNEHTTIQPTVCNSLSSQRIIRYYMRQLKGLDPAPNAGDDTSIPNLIVSYRRQLTLGERLQVEMLNVPDGSAGSYTVTALLLDEQGNTVLAHEPVTFDATRLMEHRWTIPSEELAAETLLRPVLTITIADGGELVCNDGLDHIILRATDNWDYKWIKQPLRDMIVPSEAHFAMSEVDGDPGAWRVSSSFACDEPLASLEVLEDSNEVYAYDVQDKYPDRDEQMLLRVDLRSYQHQELVGRLSIDAPSAVFHTGTDGRYFFNEGNAVRVNMWINQWRRVFFASIPREHAHDATLNLDFTVLQGDIPLSRLARHGLYSEIFEPDIQVTLEDFHRAPDLPHHIDAPEASFEVTVRPRRPQSVFHLRAITTSGKIWRSAPIMVAGVQEQPPVALDVFSDTLGETVRVAVEASRIPDIDYHFDSENGSLMWADAGVPFCGQIGGRANAVTYVGGGESGGMGNPFRNGALFPEGVTSIAPAWVSEDGSDLLRFDGVGNFIVFPREVTPRRGSWTLQMQIRPTAEHEQIIWRHHGHYIGSVTVYLQDGEIWTTYTDDQVKSTTQRPPGLRLPLNEWSTVEISYDLDTMIFRVNDQVSEPLAAPGPGMYIGTSVFGGHGRESGYFEGDLRSLRMLHRATLHDAG